MDLLPFINKAGCECLNESDEHGFENCLRKDSSYLESDCDEQVLLRGVTGSWHWEHWGHWELSLQHLPCRDCPFLCWHVKGIPLVCNTSFVPNKKPTCNFVFPLHSCSSL